MNNILHWRRKANQDPRRTTAILYFILICATAGYGWVISDQYARQMELSVGGNLLIVLLNEKGIELQLVVRFLGIVGGLGISLLVVGSCEILRRYMILRKVIQSMAEDLDVQRNGPR